MSDITALIPIHRTKGNREWLQQSINSLGKDVRYIVLENDGEVTEALNAGLRAAETPYVTAWGSDDIAGPGMLDELRAAIWNVDVAYQSMVLVNETLDDTLGTFWAHEFCPNRLLQWNYVSGCALYRREKALEVGGYRHIQTLEDWDLWVRMMRAGAKFKAVPNASMFYRQHPTSRNHMKVDIDALKRDIVGDRGEFLATFYLSPTPAVSYVRCVLPARYLPGIARPDVLLGSTDEGETVTPDHEGAAVFQLGASKTAAILNEFWKQQGRKVLVETDDNYLARGSSDFRDRAGWGRKIGDAPHTVDGHISVAKAADGLIVSTDYLASQYRKINQNVYVCPNQIDPTDWQPLEKVDDGIFRIGWFASNSHKDDIRLVTRAMEWASRQPDVEVVTLGMNPGWSFRRRHLPWATDLSIYRQMMYGIDVGLAPIVPTPFSRGRSDLKWLEYSMAGAASVVSDIESYAAVPDGLAMKAKDARGFYEAVRHLVQNKDEARQMAREAREYVLERRTVQANIDLWREAVS